jgi:heat shock protein HslJ
VEAGLLGQKNGQKRGDGVMRTTFFRTAALFALTMLVLSGCSVGQEPTPTPASVEEAVVQAVPQLPFIGTTWQVESAGETTDDLQPIEGTRLTVNFGVDRYSGSGGCNYFLGGYAVEGDVLRFYTPAMTILVCTEPEGVMEQEATYMSLLVNVTEYREDGEKLLAYTAGEQLMLTLVPAEEVPFENTVWSLKFQMMNDKPTPSYPGAETTATFDGEMVSGSAGCNTYEAGYVIDGNKLTIETPTVTEMACEDPPGVMDQESAFLASLESVTGYIQPGGVLELLGAEGQTLLLMGAP